jgi:hypothetical protein
VLPCRILSEKDHRYYEEERMDKINMEHSNSLLEKVGGKARRKKQGKIEN